MGPSRDPQGSEILGKYQDLFAVVALDLEMFVSVHF